MENYDKLIKKIINHLELNRKDNIDEPFMVFSGSKGRKSYTRRELIEALKNDEEVCSHFVNNAIMLAIDLFDRNKEKLKDFKKEE